MPITRMIIGKISAEFWNEEEKHDFELAMRLLSGQPSFSLIHRFLTIRSSYTLISLILRHIKREDGNSEQERNSFCPEEESRRSDPSGSRGALK